MSEVRVVVKEIIKRSLLEIAVEKIKHSLIKGVLRICDAYIAIFNLKNKKGDLLEFRIWRLNYDIEEKFENLEIKKIIYEGRSCLEYKRNTISLYEFFKELKKCFTYRYISVMGDHGYNPPVVEKFLN